MESIWGFRQGYSLYSSIRIEIPNNDFYIYCKREIRFQEGFLCLYYSMYVSHFSSLLFLLYNFLPAFPQMNIILQYICCLVFLQMVIFKSFLKFIHIIHYSKHYPSQNFHQRPKQIEKILLLFTFGTHEESSVMFPGLTQLY